MLKEAIGVLASVVVVGGVVLGGISLASGAKGEVTGTVERVIDGDTLDVIRDGELTRIRLLNIDTPETVDASRPVECLGPEASAYLAGRLPQGTEITLKYDEERADRYGRELAAVYLDDELINASIARQGLGIAVTYEPNHAYRDEVQQAQSEAETNARGLYGIEVGCTLPATIAAAENLPSEPGATAKSASLSAHLAGLATLMAAIEVAEATLVSEANDFPLKAFTTTQISDFSDRAKAARLATEAQTSRVTERHTTEVAADQAAAAEATAQAEAAAAAEAQRQAEAAEVEAQEDTSDSQSESTNNSPDTNDDSGAGSDSSDDGGTGSSGGDSNRAPCRAYEPGGQSFTYIDCVTKLPID